MWSQSEADLLLRGCHSSAWLIQTLLPCFRFELKTNSFPLCWLLFLKHMLKPAHVSLSHTHTPKTFDECCLCGVWELGSVILQSLLGCCCNTRLKHLKCRLNSENLRRKSSWCLFFTVGEIAKGAERSPSDLVESKRSVAGETTRSRGEKGERARDWKCLICAVLQFGSMDHFSILEGAPLLFPILCEIYTYNLKIKRGANRGDFAPTLSSLWPTMDLTEGQL